MNPNNAPRIQVGFEGESHAPKLKVQFSEGDFEIVLRDAVRNDNKLYRLVRELQGSGGHSTTAIEGDSVAYLQQILRLVPSRAAFALKYYLAPRLQTLIQWLITSKESDNYTYDNDASCMQYWASSLAIVLNCTPEVALGYLREPIEDMALQAAIVGVYDRQPVKPLRDRIPKFGRRLAWYACARALKPKLLIETGVHQGLGSVLLCAALKRNAEEGHPGTYMGTDIDTGAGSLLVAPYSQHGRVHYGDSIETLNQVDRPIDLFINDSDHSAEYEAREYATIADKLAPNAVILGDNAHVTDKLMQFSWKHGRNFIFLNEKPENHWYPGAGVGVSWGSSQPASATARASVEATEPIFDPNSTVF